MLKKYLFFLVFSTLIFSLNVFSGLEGFFLTLPFEELNENGNTNQSLPNNDDEEDDELAEIFERSNRVPNIIPRTNNTTDHGILKYCQLVGGEVIHTAVVGSVKDCINLSKYQYNNKLGHGVNWNWRSGQCEIKTGTASIISDEETICVPYKIRNLMDYIKLPTHSFYGGDDNVNNNEEFTVFW